MTDEAQIPLASAIRALRRELVEAVKEGEGQDVRFALGPIDLELQVELSTTGGGEAGIKFWVLSFGGKGERTTGRTQTLRLQLTPVRAPGMSNDVPILVGDDLPRRPE